MLKNILIAVAVAVVGFGLFVVSRPDVLHVERSTSITAPASSVYGYIQDFHQWNRWSPWDDKDPAMQRTFTGAPQGQGSEYAWVGNDAVGEGHMTIDRVDNPNQVHIQLEFLKPWKSTSEVTFSLKAADDTHTLVSWAMDSQQNFGSKAAGIFMDMDAMLGKEFERGLERLKKVAEGAAIPAVPTVPPGH